MKKVRLAKGIHLLPSLCTTGSMFLGFFAVIRSINGDHLLAAWAILGASFFDMIDGRLARMMKTQSDFGREYDSLVDLASFGLAPAVLIYTWSLMSFRQVGWFFAFLFFACAALRLARYNIQIDVVEKKRFNGLPTPAAANVLTTLVLFCQMATADWVRDLLSLLLVPSLAVLMVSRVRYRSFKEFEVRKASPFYVLIGASVLVGLIAIEPNMTLFAGFLAYALSGPMEWLVQFKKARPIKIAYRARKLSVLDFSRKEKGKEEAAGKML